MSTTDQYVNGAQNKTGMALNPKHSSNKNSNNDGNTTSSMPREQQQEHKDEDICRVCRGESTAEQPLFHPCLCSGSIKYIHQDCLVQWLKHSKKRYCELCKHSFTFQPIYKEGMPERLGVWDILVCLGTWIGGGVKEILWWSWLGGWWLGVLPTVTALCLGACIGSSSSPYSSYDSHLGHALADGEFAMDAGAGMAAFEWIRLGLIGICYEAAMFVMIVGGVLLKEYMATHGLFQVYVPTPTANHTRRRLGNNAQRTTPQTPQTTDNESDVSTAASTRSTAHSSTWLTNVTPREYRAFLRRRELARERARAATANGYFSNPNANGGNTSAANDDRHSATATSIHNTPPSTISLASEKQFVGSTTSTHSHTNTIEASLITSASPIHMHRKISHPSATLLPAPSSPLLTTAGSSVKFRDHSFKCKICKSSTCQSREHCVEASRLSVATNSSNVEASAAAVSEEDSDFVDDNDDGAFTATDTETNHHQPQRRQRQEQQNNNVDNGNNGDDINQDINNARGWRHWVGIDDEGIEDTLSLSEFIGIKAQQKNPLRIIQHCFLVFILNLGLMTCFLWAPRVFGCGVRAAVRLFWHWLVDVLANNGGPSVYFPLLAPLLSKIHGYTAAYGSAFGAAADWISDLLLHNATFVFAVECVIGYASLLVCGWTWILITLNNSGNGTTFGATVVQSAFILCSAFIKLCCVLAVELVVFPIYTGFLINFGMVPLLASDYTSIIAFTSKHFFASALVHWSVGTACLLQISKFVGWLRGSPNGASADGGVWRSGVLWWVRNPEDPDFHPIRSILQQSLWLQAKRICVSVLIYSLGLIALFGAFAKIVTCTLFVELLGLDPLPQWSFSIHYFPVDLLVHAVSGQILSILNPSLLSTLTKQLLSSVCRALCLSSFFYGGRWVDEESIPSRGRWAFVPDQDRTYPRGLVNEMAKKSVQPLDIARIPIVKGASHYYPTPAPHSNSNSSSINNPNSNSANNGHNSLQFPPEPRRRRFTRLPGTRTTSTANNASFESKGFTVVYRPHWMYTKVLILLSALWCYWQVLAVSLFVLPILVGRFAIGLFGFTFIVAGNNGGDGANVVQNDVYSLFVGLLLLSGVVRLLRLSLHYISDIQNPLAILKALAKTLFLSLPLALFKLSVYTLVIGILWPLMLGMYVFLLASPVLLGKNNLEASFLIPLIASWYIGMLYCRLAWMLRATLCSPERRQLLDSLSAGWSSLLNTSFITIFTKLLVPYTLRLGLCILAPPLTVVLIAPFFSLTLPQLLLLQQWSFVLSMCVPVGVAGWGLVGGARERIGGRIRDDRYLVGRQLRNRVATSS